MFTITDKDTDDTDIGTDILCQHRSPQSDHDDHNEFDDHDHRQDSETQYP